MAVGIGSKEVKQGLDGDGNAGDGIPFRHSLLEKKLSDCQVFRLRSGEGSLLAYPLSLCYKANSRDCHELFLGSDSGRLGENVKAGVKCCITEESETGRKPQDVTSRFPVGRVRSGLYDGVITDEMEPYPAGVQGRRSFW